MKALLITLLTLVSASAFAGINPNSSWEEIFAAKGPYRIAAPTVYMGRAIDYTFVCRDGDNLRTLKPVDIVETRSRGGSESGRTELVVVGSEVLTTPINFTQTESFCDQTHHKTVCSDRTYTGTYPMTVDIKIYKVSFKEGIERLWFTKSYTVPNCETPQPL